MFSEAGVFKAKPAPENLLPDGIANSYPHVALFAAEFCTEARVQEMVEFAKRLSLCDDVLSVRYEGADYRAFCFAERYHATVICGAFDVWHDDAGYGSVIRLTC